MTMVHMHYCPHMDENGCSEYAEQSLYHILIEYAECS